MEVIEMLKPIKQEHVLVFNVDRMVGILLKYDITGVACVKFQFSLSFVERLHTCPTWMT